MSNCIAVFFALMLPLTGGAQDAAQGAALAAKSLPLLVDGDVTLSATFYAAIQPGPGLLLLNMCDPLADQTHWNNVATNLAKRGYHVLCFDYRGFGASGGERPAGMGTIEEAMSYWRRHWMPDVRAAFELLEAQKGVDGSTIGVAGASCGVFMGLEFAIEHPKVAALVLLGGPTEILQREWLKSKRDLPILLITGDEGPSIQWSEEVFSASTNTATRLIKYKTVTHGTDIFKHHPETQDMLIEWFVNTLSTNPRQRDPGPG